MWRRLSDLAGERRQEIEWSRDDELLPDKRPRLMRIGRRLADPDGRWRTRSARLRLFRELSSHLMSQISSGPDDVDRLALYALTHL